MKNKIDSIAKNRFPIYITHLINIISVDLILDVTVATRDSNKNMLFTNRLIESAREKRAYRKYYKLLLNVKMNVRVRGCFFFSFFASFFLMMMMRVGEITYYCISTLDWRDVPFVVDSQLLSLIPISCACAILYAMYISISQRELHVVFFLLFDFRFVFFSLSLA